MKILFSEKAQYPKIIFYVAVVFVCLLAQGCLEVEEELIITKDGSGTLNVQGVLGESFTKMVKMAESMKDSAGGEATAAGMLSVSEGDLKERFKGEGITIRSSEFETKEDKLHLSYSIEFDKLQNLLKTKAFQEKQISFYRDDNDNLRFQFATDTARKELFLETTAEEVQKELKIDTILTLPGKVLESNADSEEGASLTWRYTKDKLKPEVMTAVCEGKGLAFVAKLPTEPKKKATAAYVYDPTGKADPFRPFILEIKGPPAVTKPLQPLQRYEISQLQLVGIIWMPENPRAMLEDATGKGFIVTKGSLVGMNDGKVSEIFQDEVIITEKSTDILGETKIRDIKLRLHEQEAKGK